LATANTRDRTAKSRRFSPSIILEVLKQRMPVDNFCVSKQENYNQQNNENRCLHGNLISSKEWFSIHWTTDWEKSFHPNHQS